MATAKQINGTSINSLPADSPVKSASVRELIASTQCAGLTSRCTLKSWAWQWFYGYVPGMPASFPCAPEVTPGAVGVDYSFSLYLPWYMQKQSTKINAMAVIQCRRSLPVRFRMVTHNLIDAFADTSGEYDKTRRPANSAISNSGQFYSPHLLTIEAALNLTPAALPASRRIVVDIVAYIDAAAMPVGGAPTMYMTNLVMWDE